MSAIRWGIVGTGSIAKNFVQDMRFVEDAKAVGVAGRDLEKTKRFSADFEIPQACADALELFRREDIDAVYIATPHPAHFEMTMLALEHGKHVLCEKPFMMNAMQAEQAVQFAVERKLFLMEAMWTRFLPFAKRLKAAIAKGEIGELESIQASMGFGFKNNHPPRLFELELGGGSILDMGVYAISFGQMLRDGLPDKLAGEMVIGTTGIDHKASWIFTYPGGVQVIGTSSINSKLSQDAVVSGQKGQIRLREFWRSSELEINGKIVKCPYDGVGLHFQLREACECIRSGKLESEIMTRQDSIQVLQLMDAVRTKAGLRYPSDFNLI